MVGGVALCPENINIPLLIHHGVHGISPVIEAKAEVLGLGIYLLEESTPVPVDGMLRHNRNVLHISCREAGTREMGDGKWGKMPRFTTKGNKRRRKQDFKNSITIGVLVYKFDYICTFSL